MKRAHPNPLNNRGHHGSGSFVLRILALGLLLVLLAIPVHAQDSATLSHYLQQAAQRNSALQAHFNQYYAALEEVPQAGGLPDPQILLGYFIQPVETRTGSRTFDVQLRQAFPWFGSRAARRQVATQQAKAQFQAFLQEKNNLFYAVKKEYYQLQYLQKAITLSQEQQKLLQQSAGVLREKLKTGRNSSADLLLLQIALKQEITRRENLQAEQNAVQAQLNALLNKTPGTHLPVKDSPRLPDTTVPKYTADSSLNNNPQLQKIKKEALALKAQESVVQKKGLPNFIIGLNYGLIEPRSTENLQNNGRDVLLPLVGVSLPLYRKKYRAEQKEVAYRLKSLNHSRQDLKQQLYAQYEEAQQQWHSARRNYEMYNELISKAQQGLRIVQQTFQSDRADYREVLEWQEELLQYQLRQSKALREWRTAQAQMEKLQATEISTY